MKTMRLDKGMRVTVENPVQSSGFRVTFAATPTGAKFLVNNAIYGNGQVAFFNPGVYSYTLTLEGYITKTGTFTVSVSDIVVSQNLDVDPNYVSQKGTLNVASNPSGAMFTLGTSQPAVTPLTISNITPGTYQYYFTKSGYQPVQGTITIAGGETKTLNPTMTSQYPANGTYIADVCIGYDKYKRYANGSGGYYDVLSESNSSSCGYNPPTTTTVNLTSNDNTKTVQIWRVSDFGDMSLVGAYQTPTSVPLPVGKYTFVVESNTQYKLKNPTNLQIFTAGNVVNQYIEYAFAELYETPINFRVWSTVRSYSDLYLTLETNTSTGFYDMRGRLVGAAQGSGGEYGLDAFGQQNYAKNANFNQLMLSFGNITRFKRVDTVKQFTGNYRCSCSVSFDGVTVYGRADSDVYFANSTLTYIDYNVILEMIRWV